MAAGLFLAISIFFALPANYLNDRYGLHVGVSLPP